MITLLPVSLHAATVRFCRRFMTGVSMSVGIAVALTASSAAADTPSPTNSVVAVVNADPITQNELAQASLERFGPAILDNMINRHLIMQACTRAGIEVTQDEVSAEIKRLAEKFGLSMEQYLGLLQEERGIAPGQYSREVIWPMLALRRLAADRIEVSQAEFDQAFVAQFGQAVKCRLIMVEARGKAEQIHATVAGDPGKFASMAKQHSEDESSSSVGGLIPPIRRHSGDARLEDAAFSLADGEVSPILQLGDQWIMLQAVRRIPAVTPSPDALPAIKQQIYDAIRDDKVRGASGDIFATLQNDAKVIKVLGDEALMGQYPGAAAIINGSQITMGAVAAECVKRHGVDVLDGQINRKLLTQALKAARATVSPADINAEISRAASSYGFVGSGGQIDTDGWLEAVTRDGMTTEVYIADSVWPTAALKQLVADRVRVTDDDMKTGYVAAYGPRADVLAIVLSDQRSAQKVWQSARDDGTEEGFAKLAEQYSIEPVSASNRGKVPPIRKFGGQPAVEKEVFGLKPGQLSGIVVTGGQYVILRLQGFTEPVVSDAAAVNDELRTDLTEKKMRRAMLAEMERIRDKADVENFLEVAKKGAPKVALRN